MTPVIIVVRAIGPRAKRPIGVELHGVAVLGHRELYLAARNLQFILRPGAPTLIYRDLNIISAVALCRDAALNVIDDQLAGGRPREGEGALRGVLLLHLGAANEGRSQQSRGEKSA